MEKISKKQYKEAVLELNKLQAESSQAMRAGDQQKLDETSDKAAKAFAIIAAYKAQK